MLPLNDIIATQIASGGDTKLSMSAGPEAPILAIYGILYVP